jgi:hypothetical protein
MKIKVYNSQEVPVIISEVGVFQPGDNNVDLNEIQINMIKKSNHVRIINKIRSKQKKYNKIKEK